MNLTVSANTQAILLLTAPLMAGQNGRTNNELLTHGEYRRFARQLRELGHAPADLLKSDSAEILRELDGVVPADRICRLLERGFLISQAIERWQSRAIWVFSRADSEYPKRLKNRLKEESPAVLYGCGQPSLLESGGLAVVGSRKVDQVLIEYTEAVGRQCAVAKRNVISGGAQGIDRAAMRGALEAGGQVLGVLAEALERASLNRESRNWILDEQLALVSAYDPNAGFNVGHAMQRNKIIYALADAALVVNAEYEKGGTWAGATEQLQKYRFGPVYVRSSGEIGPGLRGLVGMGARPWPNPQDSLQFLSVLDSAPSELASQQAQLSLQANPIEAENLVTTTETEEARRAGGDSPQRVEPSLDADHGQFADATPSIGRPESTQEPAEELLGCVREILAGMLITPRKETEIALELGVSSAQVRVWLRKFVKEGTLEKHTKPVRYAIAQKRLL
jgi:predicted Rossmann fold nucleotide-binding protein DprA/Smf involved in DNA uptake